MLPSKVRDDCWQGATGSSSSSSSWSSSSPRSAAAPAASETGPPLQPNAEVGGRSPLFWHQHCFVEPFDLFLASLSSSSPAGAVTATSSSSSFSWHQRCLSEPLNLFLAAPLLVQPLIQDSTTATDRLRSYPNSNKVYLTCVIHYLTLSHGQKKNLKKKKSKMQETPLLQDCVLSWPWMKSALLEDGRRNRPIQPMPFLILWWYSTWW